MYGVQRGTVFSDVHQVNFDEDWNWFAIALLCIIDIIFYIKIGCTFKFTSQLMSKDLVGFDLNIALYITDIIVLYLNIEIWSTFKYTSWLFCLDIITFAHYCIWLWYLTSNPT